jgi:hypothetical protein
VGQSGCLHGEGHGCSLVSFQSAAGVNRRRDTSQTICYADIRALVSVRSFVHRGPVALSRLGGCPKVLLLAFRSLNENSRVDLPLLERAFSGSPPPRGWDSYVRWLCLILVSAFLAFSLTFRFMS